MDGIKLSVVVPITKSKESANEIKSAFKHKT